MGSEMCIRDRLPASILTWNLPDLHAAGRVTLKQSPNRHFQGNFEYYRFRGTELLHLTDGKVTLLVTSDTTGRFRYWSQGTNQYFGGVIGDSRDNGSIFNVVPYTILANNYSILRGQQSGYLVEAANRPFDDRLRIIARVVKETPFRHLQRFDFLIGQGNLLESRSETSYDYKSDSELHTFRVKSVCKWDDYRIEEGAISLPRRFTSWVESRLAPQILTLEKSVEVSNLRALPPSFDLRQTESRLRHGLKRGRWPAPYEMGRIDIGRTVLGSLLAGGHGGLVVLVTGLTGLLAWFWYHRRKRRSC